MRRSIIIVLCIALLLAVSCKEAPEGATLRIEMDRKIRTVAPEKENMEVYGYKVILTGPEGKESAPRYTYYSYINLDGLTVGVWKVKVYGFNKERVDVCYGEVETTLTAGKNSIKVKLDQLVGTGSLALTLKWDEYAFPDAHSVRVTLKASDGTDIALFPSTPSRGRVIITKENLETGSYALTAKLLDSNGNILSGIAEAVRISNQDQSVGEITFPSETKEEENSGKVEISNDTSIPIEVTINGLESLMAENTPFTLNISLPQSSPVRLGDLDTVWYLDGELVGRGNEYTFRNGVEKGIHRIDVFTQTSNKGSMGSTTAVFQAAVSTNHGDPYQKYTLEDGENWKLGTGCVMHFLPDDRLLVASNQYKTFQLINTGGSRPELDGEFTFESLGIDGTVADFAASGDEGDSYWPVIILVNQKFSCKAVNTIVSKHEMTATDEATNFDSRSGEGRADRFVSIAATNGIFVASIENNDRSRMGIVLFNQNSTKGNMVKRDDWYSNEPFLEWGHTGYKCMSAIPENGFAIISAGTRSKIYSLKKNNSGGIGIREYMMWQSWEDFISYYNQGKCKAEFSSAQSCGFLSKDGSYAFVFSPEGIYYFKDMTKENEEYSIYYTESLLGRSIGDVSMSPDTEYCYMLDNDTHRLYTMEPKMDASKGGFVLVPGNWIDFGPKSADKIEISLSGELLAIFNKTDSSYITLVRAAR